MLKAEWQKVDCPVLAMYGAYDLAAIDDRGARQLAALINREHPGNGTFQLIEKTNHSLLEMEDFEAQLDFASSQGEVRATSLRFGVGFFYRFRSVTKVTRSSSDCREGVSGKVRSSSNASER